MAVSVFTVVSSGGWWWNTVSFLKKMIPRIIPPYIIFDELLYVRRTSKGTVLRYNNKLVHDSTH